MSKKDRDAERAAAFEEAQREAQSAIERLSAPARRRATAAPRPPINAARKPTPSTQGQGFGPAPGNYGGGLRSDQAGASLPPSPSPPAPGATSRWGAPSATPPPAGA
ncbi:MAG: hypothetical protein ACRDYC_08345, partial [Acidimicrobiales bacterium]